MRFESTRGLDSGTLRHAVFHGLASDGGLYVPQELRRWPEPPASLGSSDFAATARWAAPCLFPSLSATVVERVVGRALDFPVNLVEVEPGVHVLELFHGPTLAFKDIGARFLAGLAAVLDDGGERRTVLVATSGDTGGAVVSAFHELDGFQVVVLFPQEGISARQRRQMTTLGGNVSALAVEGTFDDCQRVAKEAFSDPALSAEHQLMSANSINVGRLLPQVLYYVFAAARVGWHRTPPRFFVPCGNLGNLCAGLFAARIGMPTAGFVAATNTNRVFVDVLAEKPFEKRPATTTLSNAMDVGDPSNLERIRWLYRDTPSRLADDVVGVSVDDEATLRCIREVHDRTGYVLDPHSAVAFEAQRRHHTTTGTSVVLATAHPAKFPEVVESAIAREVVVPASLQTTLDAEERMHKVPPTLDGLRGVLAELAP